MNKFVLGKKLRRLRIKNSLTVSTLSEILSSHNILANERTIYRWEQDISIPDLNTLKILSIIYNVNLSSIFEKQNSMSFAYPNEVRCFPVLQLQKASFRDS